MIRKQRLLFVLLCALGFGLSLANPASHASANGSSHDRRVPGAVRARLAVAPAAAQSDRVAVAQLLKPDGTLDLSTGFSGSVDLRGWRMTTDATGAPHFRREATASAEGQSVPALAGDDGWDSRFGAPPTGNGADNTVHAIYIVGNNVYVAGGFTHIGSIAVNRVAVWNGATWDTLANGFDSDVLSLGVLNGSLVAGGLFVNACGNAACNNSNTIVNNIAVLHCIFFICNWEPLGNGLDGEILTITSYLGQLYVGGSFSSICGNPGCNSGNTSVNYVAHWNGSSWSALGNGFGIGYVFALTVYGGNLYAGGEFQVICGDAACTNGNTPVNYLAEYTGSSWTPFEFGFNGLIRALVTSGNNLYAGGGFTGFCLDQFCLSSISANRLAKWDGSSWSALGDGVDNTVTSLSLSGNDLYVGGAFLNACGNYMCTSGNSPVNHIVKWNGVKYSGFGSGTNSDIYTLAASGIQVFVGGTLTTAGGKPSTYFGRWARTNLYLPLILR